MVNVVVYTVKNPDDGKGFADGGGDVNKVLDCKVAFGILGDDWWMEGMY